MANELVSINSESTLTPVQYRDLADVPAELEWLANITKAKKVDCELSRGKSRVVRPLFVRSGVRFLFLHLHGPRGHDAILPRVGNKLAEVFVRVGNEDVNNVALVSLRAELWQQLCEIRVAHTIDRFVREIPGLIQVLDDAILLGCGFFEFARFKPCRRVRTHHAEDCVALPSDMQKHFSKGPGVG